MNNTSDGSAPTLWDDIFVRAHAERERKLRGANLITRDECPVELTPMGKLRWYLHPALERPSTHALYQFEQEIPVGSRSGRLFHQGGIVHYVWKGRGYTEVNGVQHEWEETDVIGIPILPEGITFQHFNTGPDPVLLIVTFPNFDSALGPELGVAMEVLEPAPEYEAQRASVAGGVTGA